MLSESLLNTNSILTPQYVSLGLVLELIFSLGIFKPFPTGRHTLFVAIGDAFDNVHDIGYSGFRFEFSFTGVNSYGNTELSGIFDESSLNHYEFTSG